MGNLLSQFLLMGSQCEHYALCIGAYCIGEWHIFKKNIIGSSISVTLACLG